MKTKSKKDIILETAKAYTSQNRSICPDSRSSCLYKSGANKCAVGRCLLSKSRLFKSELNDTPIDNYNETELDCELKKEYRGHSIEFWQDVQYLHDQIPFWDLSGLTERGKEHVDLLIEKWDDKD
jgi:hypothetical protein